MLIFVTNWFPILDRSGIPTGGKEFVVDYAIDSETLSIVPVPNEHPENLGAVFSNEIGEWIYV